MNKQDLLQRQIAAAMALRDRPRSAGGGPKQGPGTYPIPPKQTIGGAGKQTNAVSSPTPGSKAKLGIMPVGKAFPVSARPPGRPGIKLTGRANALTRGQGKKIGLRAQYAGIKARAIAKGYKPDMADIKATYRRTQKRKLPRP